MLSAAWPSIVVALARSNINAAVGLIAAGFRTDLHLTTDCAGAGASAGVGACDGATIRTARADVVPMLEHVLVRCVEDGAATAGPFSSSFRLAVRIPSSKTGLRTDVAKSAVCTVRVHGRL